MLTLPTPKKDPFTFNAWVCRDCYDKHHSHPLDHEALAQDNRSETDLLKHLNDCALHDNTDSNTGAGINEYSTSECDGCRTFIAGTRYRLYCVQHPQA